jgi:hypothetical protein
MVETKSKLEQKLLIKKENRQKVMQKKCAAALTNIKVIQILWNQKKQWGQTFTIDKIEGP